MASQLSARHRSQAQRLYLILAGIFIASLVAGNLIFQKFFHWTPFGFLLEEADAAEILRYQVAKLSGAPMLEGYELIWTHGAWRVAGGGILDYTFEISVGILPYPVTFLVTDIVSEIYGKKKANMLVVSGFAASLFVALVVLVAQYADATAWSPVDNNTFTGVFGLNALAVLASMVAYLSAQLIDVQLFHFWKKVTKGKKLWVRNNFSTWSSQFVDTSVVLLLLCTFNLIDWELFPGLLLGGFLFKVLIAALDTPFVYLAVYGLRRKFKLAAGEELEDL